MKVTPSVNPRAGGPAAAELELVAEADGEDDDDAVGGDAAAGCDAELEDADIEGDPGGNLKGYPKNNLLR